MTRSVDDPDLMRTFGGQPAAMIRACCAEGAQADPVRDWNAKSSNAEGAPVHARNSVDPHVDLMRLFFGFGQPVN